MWSRCVVLAFVWRQGGRYIIALDARADRKIPFYSLAIAPITKYIMSQSVVQLCSSYLGLAISAGK